MSEFKTIPKLPKYEIDKEGNVQTVDKKTPIFPYPLGSRTINLTLPDKTRKSFSIDELIAEVFNVKPINKAKAIIIGGGEADPSLDPNEKKPVANQSSNTSSYTPNVQIEKIMGLDTFTSVKMWKLHESGLKVKEIEQIIGPPNSVNVASTIEKYKKNETLRKRADKVSVA